MVSYMFFIKELIKDYKELYEKFKKRFPNSKKKPLFIFVLCIGCIIDMSVELYETISGAFKKIVTKGDSNV